MSVDSRKVKEVQIADLACGAACSFLKSERRHLVGSLENRLMEVFFRKHLIVNSVWPSQEVDPESLGADALDDASRIHLNSFTEHILTRQNRPKAE